MVRFLYRGEEIVGEPHIFGRALRTRALNLKCFDLAASDWKFFSFCEIRDFEALPETFAPRPGAHDRNRKIVEIDTEAFQPIRSYIGPFPRPRA